MGKNVRLAAGIGLVSALSAAVALGLVGITSLPAQERVPGLTGVDHADDIIVSRQLLMDGVDDAMHDIDISTTGKEFKLDDLKANANTINMLLLAFPHLFPPQTKPVPTTDGSPSATSAQLAIWENFEDFYAQAQAAAAVAFAASQADSLEQFVEQ